MQHNVGSGRTPNNSLEFQRRHRLDMNRWECKRYHRCKDSRHRGSDRNTWTSRIASMPGRSGQYAVICLQIFSISKANTNLSLGHTILVPDKLWQGQNECCEAVSEKKRLLLHLNFHLALRRSFEPLWKVRVFAGMSHKGLQIQHLSSHQWMQPRLSHCCRFSFPDCRSCTDIHTASYCYHPQNKPNRSNRINQTVSTGLLVLPSPAIDWIILNRPSAVLCAVWWARIPWRCALAESIIPPWQPWATHDGELTDVSKCKGDQKTWSWSNFQTATLPRLAPRHPAQDEEKATTSQR